MNIESIDYWTLPWNKIKMRADEYIWKNYKWPSVAEKPTYNSIVKLRPIKRVKTLLARILKLDEKYINAYSIETEEIERIIAKFSDSEWEITKILSSIDEAIEKLKEDKRYNLKGAPTTDVIEWKIKKLKEIREIIAEKIEDTNSALEYFKVNALEVLH